MKCSLSKSRLFAGACLALIGLSAAPTYASAQEADVIHFWTSGAEAKAAKAIADAYTQKGGKWIDSAVVGGPAARAAAINRIAGGNPPTAMQWTSIVALRDLASQGLIANLDDEAAKGNWKAVLPPLLYDRISYEGHIIAAPLNVQASNMMFYSTKIFSDLKIEPPKNWDEFFVVADKIKAAGLTALAIGIQRPQMHYLFQSILLGTGGSDHYRKVWVDHDVAAAGDASTVKAFEVLRRLTGYVDSASPNRKWNDTSYLVQKNQAAMQIIGDWAKSEFMVAGLTPGKEFGCTLAPGNENHLITIVDLMAFPASNQDAARQKLAETVMDPAVQVAFNSIKGSLPSRTDAKIPNLDMCGTLTEKVVQQSPQNLVPGYSGVFSGDTEGAIGDLIVQYWNDPKMTAGDAAKSLAGIVSKIDK